MAKEDNNRGRRHYKGQRDLFSTGFDEYFKKNWSYISKNVFYSLIVQKQNIKGYTWITLIIDSLHYLGCL